jgi:Sulfotransferase domain
MSLSVIGSGFPRTGTLSLKLALNQLGFGPCFHATELLTHSDRLPLWIQAGDGNADWEAVFAGYHATVDAPGCFFWRELAERYPDAKVLHSVRDPQGWFDSTQATVNGPNSFAMKPPPPAKPFFDMLARRRGKLSLQNRDEMLAWFERHTDEVRATIPAWRLLVFEVREGWAPLCAFLGVPIPARPFPRVNVRAELADLMAQPRGSDAATDVDRMREGFDRITNPRSPGD